METPSIRISVHQWYGDDVVQDGRLDLQGPICYYLCSLDKSCPITRTNLVSIIARSTFSRSPTMHLMYTLDENGSRVYTLKVSSVYQLHLAQ